MVDDCEGMTEEDYWRGMETAIVSLPYSLHHLRGCQVIERAAVLRIIEAHLARIKTPNAELRGRPLADGPA